MTRAQYKLNWQRNHRAANPGKHAAESRQWRVTHPGAKAAEGKRYRAQYPDRARKQCRENYAIHAAQRVKQMGKNRRIRLYRITEQQFQDMLVQQNNKCAICGNPFTKTPHIDHDHNTNTVRSLLCGNCNTGLGMFHDNPILLQKAAVYLI